MALSNMRCTTLTDVKLEPECEVRLAFRHWWFLMLSWPDDAISLQVNLALGDDCLVCTTPREEYSLVPPPKYRDILFAVGCELVSGGGFLGKLRQLASRMFKSSISTLVKVQREDVSRTWIGTYTHQSIHVSASLIHASDKTRVPIRTYLLL